MSILFSKKSLDRASFLYSFLWGARSSGFIALLSLLCSFENSTKFSKISFDSDYFPNSYKVYVLIPDYIHTMPAHFENGKKLDGKRLFARF